MGSSKQVPADTLDIKVHFMYHGGEIFLLTDTISMCCIGWIIMIHPFSIKNISDWYLSESPRQGSN